MPPKRKPPLTDPISAFNAALFDLAQHNPHMAVGIILAQLSLLNVLYDNLTTDEPPPTDPEKTNA